MIPRRPALLVPARRAYAMVLVILLASVAGLTIAVMLDRHAQAALAEQRTVRGYERYHEQQGMRDLVSTIKNFLGSTARDRDDAEEIRMITEDGLVYTVRVRDEQGRILVDPTSSEGPVMRRAADLLRQTEGDAARKYFRDRGPVRVNVNTAPEPVLGAIIRAIDPEGPADAFAQAVARARRDRPIKEQDLAAIFNDVGLDQEVVAIAVRGLAVESGLTGVEVEIRDREGRVAARYAGLGIPRSQRGNGVGSEWVFLTFDHVEQFTPADPPPPR